MVARTPQNIMPLKRFFQDTQFVLTHLNGSLVDELLGVTAHEIELQPALVLLKPRAGMWQRFFLDVCFGVWEEQADLDISEYYDDDSFGVVDYASRFALRGATLLEVRCDPVDSINSRILLRLSVGDFQLGPTDPNTFDSRSVVSFR